MAKETNKRVNIWINNHEVENNIKAIRAEFNKVANELKKATIGSEEYNQKLKELKKLKEILDEHSKAVQTVAEAHAENKKNMQNSAMAWGGAAAAIQGATAAVRRFVSTVQQYVDAYAKVDDAMQAVVKSSGLARTQVEYLRESLMKLDTKTSTEELLKIAEIGGHLGLNEKQLRDFVESTDQAMQTIGLSAEEVANGFSKIQRQFSDVANQDISVTIKQAGSAMNALDVVTTSTESNIMAFTEAVGRLSDGIKPTLADTLALGAAFESAGVDAEQAATGYARILTTARANVDKFAESMGRPVEEIRNLINTNPAQFLLEFGESLRNLPTTEQGEKLKEIGLGSARLDATLGALINHTDEFRTALAKSNEEYVKATAMTENFNALNSTSAAQLEKAKKAVEDAKAALGRELIPVLTKLINAGTSGIKVLTSAVKFLKDNKVLTALLVVQLVKLLATRLKLNLAQKASIALHAAEKAGLAMVTTFTNLYALAKAKLTQNTLAAANAQKALRAAFAATPWGAIITAVVAVVSALKNLISKTNEAAKIQHNRFSQVEADYRVEELRIKKLTNLIHDETKSRMEREKAIKDLKEIIPEYLGYLDEEGNLIDDNTKAIERYLKVFKLKLEAEAYTDIYKQYLEEAAKWELEHQEQVANANTGNPFSYLNRFYRWVTGQHQYEELATLWRDRAQGVLSNIMNIEAQIAEIQQEGSLDFETAQQRNQEEEDAEAAKAAAKELRQRQQELRKKLADFAKNIKRETLDEFTKSRLEIMSKYAELYNEMYELGLDRELRPTLDKLRDEAFKNMTNDLIKKYTEATKKVMETIDKSPEKKYANKFEEDLDKDQQKWSKAIGDVYDNILDLTNLYSKLHDASATDEELDAVSAAIDAQNAELKRLESLRIQSQADIIKRHYEEILKYADEKNKEQRRAAELAGKTEKEQAELRKKWKIQDLQEEYDIRIQLAQTELAAKEALNDKDEEGLKKIRNLITELKRLKDEVPNMVENDGKAKQTAKDDGLLSLFNISSMDPWEENLKRAVNALEELRATAMDVFNSMVEMQQNAAEQELNRFTEAQDAKSRKLQQQLDEGLISQKYYDAQMEKMEAEREKKEKQIRHDEWEREHKASLANAIISGALAASNSLANGGGVPWGLIPMAISLATTAANIAVIASQVNPYAGGGYIRKKQLALVGEKGPEWVASNTLLEDNETAPVIAALEDYQRGNRSPLRMVAPTQPAWKNLSQSASQISSTFASNRTPVVHHHYQTAGGDELLKEVKQMNQFLADPKNRQAYISYKIQTEAQKNRDFIKQAAKL